MYVTGLTLSLKPKEQDGWESCNDEEEDDSDGEWIDVHHFYDADTMYVCDWVNTCISIHG